MTVKEFLKTERGINLASLAFKMYPNNKSANTYLVNKLNKNDNRNFTQKDAELALNSLKELSIKIINLSL